MVSKTASSDRIIVSCSFGKLNTECFKMTLQEKADHLNVSPHTLRNWKRRDESVRSGSGDLTSRANKLNSRRRILPKELLKDQNNIPLLTSLTERLKESGLSIPGALLFFVLEYLKVKGLAGENPEKGGPSLEDRVQNITADPALKSVLSDFLATLDQNDKTLLLPDKLFEKPELPLTGEYDLPGLVYQSLRQEGSRSRTGSWFTPLPVVDALLDQHQKKHQQLFDPCCGSGLFLCRFAELKGSTECVRGRDTDPLAVFLARINLYVLFPVEASLRAVRQGDSLNNKSWDLTPRTLIATNPPWGAHLKSIEKKSLAEAFPGINSGESASYFMAKAVREMPEGGMAAFLIPQALFYVKAHRDIRDILLRDAPPVEIREWGRLFKGVYSEVLSCHFIKEGKHRRVKVLPRKESLPLKRFCREEDRIINIHCSNEDQALIDRVEKGRTRSFPENCLWLLGVVTGDNNRFIQKSKEADNLPLLTGKELKPFAADPVNCYLRNDFSALQQSRKPDEYGLPKIIYRFIGHRPVFSLDLAGMITLNSANCIVAPEKRDLEEMVFWYNSALFRFLWYKKYRSVKMLRHQLFSLPLPLWSEQERKELPALVKEGEKRQDMPPEGDRLIFRHFNLGEKEIRRVLENRY